MSIWPLYVPRSKDSVKSEVERLALAKGVSKNRMAIQIIEEWIANNRRYVDRKITDFESESVEKIKKEIPVYCPECGSIEVDEGGFTIHDRACSWNYEIVKGEKK